MFTRKLAAALLFFPVLGLHAADCPFGELFGRRGLVEEMQERPDDIMFREMDTKGFRRIGGSGLANEFLPLQHNSVETILDELNGEAFRAALRKRIGLDPDQDLRMNVRLYALLDGPEFRKDLAPEWLFYTRARRTQHYLWLKVEDLPHEALQKLEAVLKKYTRLRLDGHSQEFVMTGLFADTQPQEENADPHLARLLEARPEIPPHMLVKTEETHIQHPIRPNPDLPEGYERTGEEWLFHVFKLTDGGLIWRFAVSLEDKSISVGKSDAQEEDPVKGPIISRVKEEIIAEMKAEGRERAFGFAPELWFRMKGRLREDHDIIWRSPSDLHPNSHFH